MSKIAAGAANKQVHANAEAFYRRQIAVECFGAELVYLSASWLESHSIRFPWRVSGFFCGQVAEPVKVKTLAQAQAGTKQKHPCI